MFDIGDRVKVLFPGLEIDGEVGTIINICLDGTGREYFFEIQFDGDFMNDEFTETQLEFVRE